MAIPVFRRLSVQDTPDAPRWVDGMFSSINLFGEGTINALTKNLVIGQNVQGQKFIHSFATTNNYATGEFNPISLSYTGGGQPSCVMIGSITTTGTPILNAVTISQWALNINKSPAQININYITGLQALTTYTIVVIAL